MRPTSTVPQKFCDQFLVSRFASRHSPWVPKGPVVHQAKAVFRISGACGFAFPGHHFQANASGSPSARPSGKSLWFISPSLEYLLDSVWSEWLAFGVSSPKNTSRNDAHQFCSTLCTTGRANGEAPVPQCVERFGNRNIRRPNLRGRRVARPTSLSFLLFSVVAHRTQCIVRGGSASEGCTAAKLR